MSRLLKTRFSQRKITSCLFLAFLFMASCALPAFRLHEFNPKIMALTQSDQKANEDTTIYMIVQIYPEFSGGNAALSKFIQSSSKYPVSLIRSKSARFVACKLLIEKDGTVSNVLLMKSNGDAKLEEESKRIFNKMPKWRAGSHNGQLVRTYKVLTLYFT